MPNDLTNPETSVERISRFQSFQAGQYWRARRNIVAEGIKKDTVLLIQSIRWVDDAPHTVILRPHPTLIGTQTPRQTRRKTRYDRMRDKPRPSVRGRSARSFF